MTKQDLLKKVAATPGVGVISRRQAAVLVDAVFAHIADFLVEARPGSRKKATRTTRFTYPGFGTFTRRVRNARRVRNPQTGEPMEIPPAVTVSFQPGQELRGALNGHQRRKKG
jgi:DNA-binding protein HU-beta